MGRIVVFCAALATVLIAAGFYLRSEGSGHPTSADDDGAEAAEEASYYGHVHERGHVHGGVNRATEGGQERRCATRDNLWQR